MTVAGSGGPGGWEESWTATATARIPIIEFSYVTLEIAICFGYTWKFDTFYTWEKLRLLEANITFEFARRDGC